MSTTEPNLSAGARTREDAQSKSTPVDELADRLSHVQGVSEDTAMFLARNWQKLLCALGTILLFAVIFNSYQGIQSRKTGEASARFNNIAEEYRAIVPKLASQPDANESEAAKTERENKQKALLDGLDIINETYSSTAYAPLSLLYLAGAQSAEGKFDVARKTLQAFPIDKYKSITSAKSGKDTLQSTLPDELAALQYARILLRENSTDASQARTLLTGIAYGGRFVFFEALLALHRLASTDAERAQIQEITKNLLAARPESRELVRTQLAGEGFAISE